MKILVTGGGGFLGSWVVSMLLDKGFRVKLLIRKPKKGLLLSAEVIYGDLGDSESLKSAVKRVQGVIHCAAKNGVWGALSGYIETNTMGTANLIKAARREGLGYFVHTSTFSVIHSSSSLEGVTEVKPYSLRLWHLTPTVRCWPSGLCSQPTPLALRP
jgi:nucleoside-diphosphate-sugar epimerase